jgi:hypothetical protein
LFNSNRRPPNRVYETMHNYMKRRSQSRNDPDQSSRVHRSDRSKRKVVVDASSTTSSVTSTTVYPHVMVQHNYHDHTNDPVAKAFLHDDDGMVHDADATNLRLFNMSFPIKLYEMLEKVEHDGNADVISWQPHGRCVSYGSSFGSFHRIIAWAHFRFSISFYPFPFGSFRSTNPTHSKKSCRITSNCPRSVPFRGN